MSEFLTAVQGYYANLGIHLEQSDIYATAGGSEALQMALTCILDEGDEILIPEPFYPNYNTFVSVTGGVIRPIPTTPEEGYRYADRARIEAEINEHTRAIVCTNPGNPTGVVLTPEEMRMLVDVAKEHGLFIIGDEAYREFVYAGEPLASMAQFDDAAENVVIVDSISKRFSACGARVGILVSRNRELMAQALKICQGRLCAATLDQLGAAALYGVGSDYFSAVREEYHRRRDTCMEGPISDPPAWCASAPRALSTSWPSCRWMTPTSSRPGCWRSSRTTGRPSCSHPARASTAPRQGPGRGPAGLYPEAGGSAAGHGGPGPRH